MRAARQQGRGAQPGGVGRRAGDAGDRRRCPTTSSECAAARRGDRLPGDAQGALGRRRARHARRSRTRRQLAASCCRGAARGARPPSARTRSISRSWSSAPATSRCRSSATATATLVHLFERDCTVQRRHQKVVERAPAPYPRPKRSARELCGHGARRSAAPPTTSAPARSSSCMDADTGSFYFIEVNPRIQVEHTVTEEVTGIDIVKAQIRIAEGARIGTPEIGVPPQERHPPQRPRPAVPHHHRGPGEQLHPRLRPHHRLSRRRPASASGSTAAPPMPARSSRRFYDSLLEKVTAWAPTPEEAIARMHRALREFRIRGVVDQPAPSSTTSSPIRDFADGELHHALHRRRRRSCSQFRASAGPRDQAPRPTSPTSPSTAIPRCAAAPRPPRRRRARRRAAPSAATPPRRAREQMLDAARARRASRSWMRDAAARAPHRHHHARRAPVAARDAHAHATTSRAIAAPTTRASAASCSRSNAGAARPSTSRMRFLTRGPVGAAGAAARARCPTSCCRCCCAAPTASATPTTPTTWCASSCAQAAAGGVDLFRIFDSPQLGREHARRDRRGAARPASSCEAAICYTGDLLDPARAKYDLNYYVGLAQASSRRPARTSSASRTWRACCKPRAARELVEALREEIGLPIHFHTHDTSGIAAASVLAAVEAGVGRGRRRRSMPSAASPRSRASARSSRRCAARPRDPGLDPDGAAADLASTGRRCAASTRAFESDLARRRLRGLPARDAGRPVHQPARSRRARSASRSTLARGGAGLRRGQPACSATSSR